MVAARFQEAFASETLSVRLAELVNDPEYPAWKLLRDFLSHRGAPGRSLFAGGEHDNMAHWHVPGEGLDATKLLTPSDLRRRLGWLETVAGGVVQAGADFARQRIA